MTRFVLALLTVLLLLPAAGAPRPAPAATAAAAQATASEPVATGAAAAKPKPEPTRKAGTGKKKKNKKKKTTITRGGCRLRVSGKGATTTWTLRQSCTLTSPIVLPATVDFNGNSRIITIPDPGAGALPPQALVAMAGTSVTVRDLLIVGPGLGRPCSPTLTPITLLALDAAAVTVRDVMLGFVLQGDVPPAAGGCFAGLEARGRGPDSRLTVASLLILGGGVPALTAREFAHGTIVDGAAPNGTVISVEALPTVSDAPVALTAVADFTMTGIDIVTAQGNGLTITDSTGVTLADSNVSGDEDKNTVATKFGVGVVVTGTAADITLRNIFVSAFTHGARFDPNTSVTLTESRLQGIPDDDRGFGVIIKAGVTGAITNNSIFFYSDSCAIVNESAGPITISGNFDNTDNEAPVCS